MKPMIFTRSLLIVCTFALYPLLGAEPDVSGVLEQLEQTKRERDEAWEQVLKLQKETASKIQDLSTAQEQLNQQLEKADHSILGLQTEAAQSNAAMRQAEHALVEKTQELSSLRTEFETTKQKLEQLQTLPPSKRRDFLVEEMQSRLGKQLLEISQAQYQTRLARAEMQELKELHVELKSSLKASRRTESLSTAKLAALESRLGALNRKVTHLAEERDALVEDKKRLTGMVTTLRARLTEAQKNEYTQEHVTALEESLSKARQDIQTLQQELEVRRAIPDLREAFAAMERERNLLQAKQKALTLQMGALETSLREEQALRKEERQEFTLRSQQLENAIREEQETHAQEQKALVMKTEELERALQEQEALHQKELQSLTQKTDDLAKALERQGRFSVEQRALTSRATKLEQDLRKELTVRSVQERRLKVRIEELERALRQRGKDLGEQKRINERADSLERELRKEVKSRKLKEEQLLAKVQALEEEIEAQRSVLPQDRQQLVSEISRLEKALTAEQSARSKQEKDLGERLTRLKTALAKEREDTGEEQALLTKKVAKLESTLQEERADLVNEKELRRGLQLEMGREQTAKRSLEKEIRRLEAGLKAATSAGVDQEELAEVNMLVEKLRQENDLLRKESLKSREDVDLLMSKLNDQSSRQGMQIRELQTMLSEQMLDMTAAQRKIETLEATAVSYEKVKKQRDELVQIRDKARGDMKVLAKHIYELRAQVAKHEKIESQLEVSTERQRLLAEEIQRQRRLATALKTEQARKDQQILDLKKRLSSERDEDLFSHETEVTEDETRP